MKQTLEFNEFGVAVTTTKSGKEAVVYQNDMNIMKVYFQLVVDGRTVFNRGSLEKVLQKLEQM